jgi:deoxyribose-phosphate aldolase
MIEAARYSLKTIAKTIDHSLLKPEMTREEVRLGCEIAKKYDVASVCCKPSDVKFCAELLQGTDVEVGTVVGFPHGSSATATKVFETTLAVKDGATEIDMVINVGALKSGDFDYVLADIAAVVNAAAGKTVKVILEMPISVMKKRSRLANSLRQQAHNMSKLQLATHHLVQPSRMSA